jgi:hypothetical protein
LSRRALQRQATDNTVPGAAETASRDAEVSLDRRAEKHETQQHQKNRGDRPEQIAVETDRKTDRCDKKTGSRERRRNASREPIGARSMRRRRGACDEWKVTIPSDLTSTDAGCSSMNHNAVGPRYHLFHNYGSEGGLKSMPNHRL